MERTAVRRGQLGLTLIEVLISIAIGLVVVGAITYLYIGSRGAYRGNEALARVQEAGRFALDSIMRDVRRAGALGCGTTASIAGQGAAVKVNVLGTALTLDPSGQPIPIQGFEPAAYQPLPVAAPVAWTAPAAWPASWPAYYGGDVLQLQVASGIPARVTAMDTTAGTVTVASNTAASGGADFRAGNYAVLANCATAAVFQVSGTPAAAAPAVLAYAPPSAVVPLTTPGQFSLAVDTYPTLQHFEQVTYFVGKLLNTPPALYRYALSSANPPEELVENVEDMDVVYGVDNTPNDGVVSADVFWKASQVTAQNAWPNVVSVRVSVTAVGDQPGAAPPGQSFLVHGTDATPLTLVAQTAPDTRLRQVFNATAALRDRLQ